jgi:hypothetical protein
MAAHQVNITDRAKRYRAQNNVTGPRKCVLCGSRADLGVMHLTGNESHGERENLAYGCRSCNGKLAAAFKTLNLGKPTNQYNPSSSGVPTFEQYMWAVSNHERKAHDAGGAVIHATPKHKRIEYARRIVSKAQQTKRVRLDDRWNPATRQNLFGFGVKPAPAVRKRRGGLTLSEAASAATKAGRKSRDMSDFDGWLESKHLADRSDGFVSRVRDSYKRGVAAAEADDRNGEYLKSLPKSRAAKSTTFKGRSIKPTESGAWVVPSIDKESEFDTVQDAKAFITSWKRNPGNWFPTRTYAQSEVDRLSVKGIKARIVDAKAKQGGYKVVPVKKRNPASGAAEVFEDFHGFGPTEVVTVSKEVHHHAHLASLGELVQLDVFGVDERGHKIKGFKGALLACNESRDQLFIEGGDQSINLKEFGIKQSHEMETLGQVTNIGYQTNKTHLGDEGGEAVYVHRFRATNQNGKHVVVKMTREPDLIYDVRNEQLLFSGGSYEILREGINK